MGAMHCFATIRDSFARITPIVAVRVTVPDRRC